MVQFWLGCTVIAAAAAALVWRVLASRNWVVTDALIVDFKQVEGPSIDGGADTFYEPIVQLRAPDGGKITVRLNKRMPSREGGTVVVRYRPGEPARARLYHSPAESLLMLAGLALFGLLLIATSD